jgi:hypothetical protein
MSGGRRSRAIPWNERDDRPLDLAVRVEESGNLCGRQGRRGNHRPGGVPFQDSCHAVVRSRRIVGWGANPPIQGRLETVGLHPTLLGYVPNTGDGRGSTAWRWPAGAPASMARAPAEPNRHRPAGSPRRGRCRRRTGIRFKRPVFPTPGEGPARSRLARSLDSFPQCVGFSRPLGSSLMAGVGHGDFSSGRLT